jgi:hypothetical protein
VSGAPAQHELGAGVDVAHRLEQVGDALLARDAPDEDDHRCVGIDAVAFEDVRAGVGRVLVGVDPVVDRGDAVGVDRRIGGEQVGAHPLRDGDDRVGRLHRRAFAERRQRVAAAQLLGLPRTQRLERVHGDHVRDVVHELGQVPPKFAYQVWLWTRSASAVSGHRQVDRHRAQGGELQRRAVERVQRLVTDGARPVGAPGVHVDLDQVAQLARGTRRARRPRRTRRRGTRVRSATLTPRPWRPWG